MKITQRDVRQLVLWAVIFKCFSQRRVFCTVTLVAVPLVIQQCIVRLEHNKQVDRNFDRFLCPRQLQNRSQRYPIRAWINKIE